MELSILLCSIYIDYKYALENLRFKAKHSLWVKCSEFGSGYKISLGSSIVIGNTFACASSNINKFKTMIVSFSSLDIIFVTLPKKYLTHIRFTLVYYSYRVHYNTQSSYTIIRYQIMIVLYQYESINS